mgnify:CR=1 FL=1
MSRKLSPELEYLAAVLRSGEKSREARSIARLHGKTKCFSVESEP